jgi:aldehyde dehydrogenase (NAD+)
MEAAAKHLTPFTLELGGKSPCVVDEDANLNRAADRIIWGKLVNAGQTCVAPDYLYVHEKVKEAFVDEIKVKIRKNYGDNPKNSPDYARIINKKHFERLRNLVSGSKVLIGGDADRDELYIAPTIVDEVKWSNPLMQEEIFGPVLPILTFKNLDDVIRQINDQPKPLALYYFSSSKKKQQKIMKEVSFGGGCINDTLLQFSNSELPVGGVGNSGVGQYHGEESFYTFSHKKSIVNKGTWIDVPLRYPPYEGKLKWLKLLFRH